MKEKKEKDESIIKKFWFVGLIALLFIVFVGWYAIDAYDNREIKVSTKQVDGKYVIYSMGGKNYFADDLFEDIKGNNTYILLNEYLRAVANEAVETTDDMKTYGTNYAYYYYQTNGASSYYELGENLKNYGYNNGVDDIQQYVIDSLKIRQILTDYYKANQNMIDEFVSKEQPVKVSHILIKVSDVDEVKDEAGNVVSHVANPTEAETTKLNTVLEELKTKTFVEVATSYSEDSSASSGGSLGVVTKSSSESYVTEFKNAIYTLEKGKVSEVITTQYGYHIILVEELEADEEDGLIGNEDFFDALNSYYEKAEIASVYLKGQELGFEVIDEDLKETLDGYLKADEEEASE